MIRCLCVGAAPIARLLSPLETSAHWPDGVAAFLAGETTPLPMRSSGHEDRGGETRRTGETSIFQ